MDGSGGRLGMAAAQVDEVKAWLSKRPLPECHLLDALARFSHLPSFDVDACFATLQRQGVLVRRTGSCCPCRAACQAGARGLHGVAAAHAAHPTTACACAGAGAHR